MNELFNVNGTKYRVREKDLKTKQTEDDVRLASLFKEFDDHPSSGLTPPKVASILKEAEQGNLVRQAQLAEDIEEKDAHIHAELYKRKSALLSVEWSIQPPANASAAEIKDAANIEDALKDQELTKLMFHMGDGILKGYSNIEYQWQNQGSFRIPTQFEHRPATWFQTDPDQRNVLKLRNNTHEGESLRPLTWIQHRHPAKSGYVARSGLVRQLTWPFLFKNYSVRDLAEFLEIYGIPARIGLYPSGATNNEKSRLLQAVMSLGHNAGGIMPKGMEIEYKAHAQGQSDPFMAMVNWCEGSQSKAILGQTLTAQAGTVGSQALGNVHNEVRQDIRDSDLTLIAETLTSDLVLPAYMLNGSSYQNPNRKPKFVFDTQEPEDIKMMSESLPKLVNMGMKISVEHAHERLKIPMATEGQAYLGQQNITPNTQTQVELSNKITGIFAALKNEIKPGLNNVKNNNEDPLDKATQQLESKASSILKKLSQPVENLVDNAESLEQLFEDIAALEGELDETQLAELMQQAFAASELMGRYEVSEDSE